METKSMQIDKKVQEKFKKWCEKNNAEMKILVEAFMIETYQFDVCPSKNAEILSLVERIRFLLKN